MGLVIPPTEEVLPVECTDTFYTDSRAPSTQCSPGFCEAATEHAIAALLSKAGTLAPAELAALIRVAEGLGKDAEIEYLLDSDIFPRRAADALAVRAKVHHASSDRAISKEAAEDALLEVLLSAGADAKLAPKNNPGHDMTIDGQRVSIKTQGDRTISDTKIKISKFMEAGAGAWPTTAEGFESLRLGFIDHLTRYERILMIRKLRRRDNHYEILEIPKEVLMEVLEGEIVLAGNDGAAIFSRNPDGSTRFKLLFDGGGVRKIGIHSLDKHLCTLIANVIVRA